MIHKEMPTRCCNLLHRGICRQDGVKSSSLRPADNTCGQNQVRHLLQQQQLNIHLEHDATGLTNAMLRPCVHGCAGADSPVPMQPPSIQPIGPIPGGPIPTHTPGIMPDNHNSRKLAQVRLLIKLFLYLKNLTLLPTHCSQQCGS